MNLIPLSFILSGLLALPAAAAGSSPATDSASPALVQLDQKLTAALEDKAHGRLTAGHYAEFAAKFRYDLGAAKAGAPPTAANASLYIKILARLGEDDPALASQGLALGGFDSKAKSSRAHFDGQTTPAVLSAERAILKSEPFSEGRGDPGALVAAGGSQQKRKIRFVQADPETLPFKPSVKISPAAAPPDLIETPSSKDSGPLPLVPLAVAVGLGAAAYGVSQSKAAYVSKDGLDDAHPVEPGPYQRLVANTILAGALGGVIYLAGAAVLTAAAPVVLKYAEPMIQQGVRLAGSETGAINPDSVTTEVLPEAEESAAEVDQIVLERGERGLHLFKFRDATSSVASGWGKGDRFLYLPNQGSPAANWVQNSRFLRLAMREGRPIYDSYVDALSGKQIPTTGFLNAERYLLEHNGWIFNPQTGAYHPPTP